jgi:hypothetical protein
MSILIKRGCTLLALPAAALAGPVTVTTYTGLRILRVVANNALEHVDPITGSMRRAHRQTDTPTELQR